MSGRAALVGAVAVALAAIALAGPAPGRAASSVRFAVVGDWGDGSAAQAQVARRMCAEAHRGRGFAFVLTTGDNFYSPDGTATAANFYRPERCLRRLGLRWHATWGNHDLSGRSTATVLRSPRHYYAFSAGPARIIVLDANMPSDRAQLAFLRRQLSRTRRPVKIVAFHQPAYTAGLHPPGITQRRLWSPLFRRYGVALVLQGHNHLYERFVVGGVTYITTGGGGGPLYLCLRPSPLRRRCVVRHNFLAVNVGPRAVAVRAIEPGGRTIERVRIAVPPRAG